MENYEVIGQIGKGNFGYISKIKRKNDGKILVWKEIDYSNMNEKEKQQIVSEVNILRDLKHPNIVKYYDRIIDKKNSKIFIIMEYCEAGDIGAIVKKCRKNKENLAEDIIWKIFSQLVLALHECHSKKDGKILHRDIKLTNVFLDNENNIKLGDFGLSRVLSNESVFAISHVGTPYYMSPEQIDDLQYNEKSDIWSLGCFLYEITTLNPPFEATNHLALAKKIKIGKVEKIPLIYSEELQRVISWMLTFDQNKRPSVENLINLPQVSLRLRERRIKDNMFKLKKLEESLKEKEGLIIIKEQALVNREKEIALKEDNINRKEEELIRREKKLEDKEMFTLKSIEKFEFKDNFLTNNYTIMQENNSNNQNKGSVNTNYCETSDKGSFHRKESISNSISKERMLLETPQNNNNSHANKNSSISRDTNYTINIDKSNKSSINETLNTSKTSQIRKQRENEYNKLLSSPNYNSINSNQEINNSPKNYTKYTNNWTPRESNENILHNLNPKNNFTNPMSCKIPLQINQNNCTNNLQKNSSYKSNFSSKTNEEKSVSSSGNISILKCLNTNSSDFKFDSTIYTGKNNYNFNSNLATNRNVSSPSNNNNCFNIASSNNINLKVYRSQKSVNKSNTPVSNRSVNTFNSLNNTEKTPQTNIKIQKENKIRYTSIATANNEKVCNTPNKTTVFYNHNNNSSMKSNNLNSNYKN